MDKRKMFLKNAGILLLALIMILSSGIAIANTIGQNEFNSATVNTQNILNDSPFGGALIWDNVVGVSGYLGGIIVSTVRTEGTAFPADDFKLGSQKIVDSIFWQGGYFQCQNAEGEKDYNWDWRIIFWDDSGDESHPGNEIYNQTISDALITREFWYNFTHPTNGNVYWIANYSVDLPVSITFNANTKYWITIQGIQGVNAFPQACWCRHNGTVGGLKLHEALIKAAWWGFPDWTNLSAVVSDKIPHDLNYQLFGPVGNSPPGKPTIKGPAKVAPNVTKDFTFNAEDPDADDLFYYIDWGDGNNSGWIGLFGSAVDVIKNHSWEIKGEYTIKAKVKDITVGAESDWGSITIKVPRIRSVNNFFNQILKRFPNIFPILKNLLIK